MNPDEEERNPAFFQVSTQSFIKNKKVNLFSLSVVSFTLKICMKMHMQLSLHFN